MDIPRRRAINWTAALLLSLALVLAQRAAAAEVGHAASSERGDRSLAPKAEREPSEGQLREPAEGSTATSLASELGSSGSIDPLSGLGIRNPVCDDTGADPLAARPAPACEITGTPETTYPTSDYGFDVFIPTGVTHPIGDFTAGFVTILNGIWLGLLFVLKLVLTLLGLAFGLNPFADGPTMARISAAVVARSTTTVTEPWLSALVVCAGIALAWRGLISRDVAGSVAGTIAAVAMLVLGLWVVHAPRETVGRLAVLLRTRSPSASIAAPQSGSLARPDRLLRRSDEPRLESAWSRSPSPASTSPTSTGRSARRPKRR